MRSRRRLMARVRELMTRGRKYLKERNGFYPDKLRRSDNAARRKVRAAFGDGCGWFSQLLMLGSSLGLYTITLKDLNLESLESEKTLYDYDSIERIKDAVFASIDCPFWARVEVGYDNRRTHVHILAHEAPKVRYHLEPVTTPEGMIAYLCKAPAPHDVLSIGMLLDGRDKAQKKGRKRLPKVSFSRGIPRK
jgi:hypothetical protein